MNSDIAGKSVRSLLSGDVASEKQEQKERRANEQRGLQVSLQVHYGQYLILTGLQPGVKAEKSQKPFKRFPNLCDLAATGLKPGEN